MNQKKLKHLMVDLETMGFENTSVICSVGAVEFDLETGETGEEFYMKVDMKSCLDAGLTVDASTILWWMQQSDAARAELCSSENRHHLAHVMYELSMFISRLDDDIQLWGNSNRFDMGILHNAYNAISIKTPWKHQNERDVRTLVSFAPSFKKNTPFTGIRHLPIDDCKHQIRYCVDTWNYIRTAKVPSELLPDHTGQMPERTSK